MATAVDQALAELRAALAVAQPQLRGLQFFLRLDQTEATKRILEQRRVDTERRIGVLTAAETALGALLGDGYPDVPVQEVPDAVLTDLTEDMSVEEAALALFASDRATKITVTADAPEPK
jgi:hypothetical protein